MKMSIVNDYILKHFCGQKIFMICPFGQKNWVNGNFGKNFEVKIIDFCHFRGQKPILWSKKKTFLSTKKPVKSRVSAVFGQKPIFFLT